MLTEWREDRISDMLKTVLPPKIHFAGVIKGQLSVRIARNGQIIIWQCRLFIFYQLGYQQMNINEFAKSAFKLLSLAIFDNDLPPYVPTVLSQYFVI